MSYEDSRAPSRPAFRSIMGDAVPLVAVLHVETAEHAEPLLAALEAGGIGLVEVTLRTGAGLEVIERMRASARKAVVGAGTLIRPSQLASAKSAGAQFLVGPAFSSRLADAAEAADLPFLPGATTPSEIVAATEFGFNELKFFPAELNGGIGWIRHMRPLFPNVTFCPTGGINNGNSADFLREPNMLAVGGMFMAPVAVIEAQDWSQITKLAREAVDATRRPQHQQDFS